MTEHNHFHPARLMGFRSLGYVYCRHCATEAFADSGDAILSSEPGAFELACCSCGQPLTPAPSLDAIYARRTGTGKRQVTPDLGEVIA